MTKPKRPHDSRYAAPGTPPPTPEQLALHAAAVRDARIAQLNAAAEAARLNAERVRARADLQIAQLRLEEAIAAAGGKS